MTPLQRWAVSNAFARGLVITWSCAPFGPIKLVKWFIRWKSLGRVAVDLNLACDKPSDAGYLFAPRMVEVYGYERARLVALATVRIEGNIAAGHPFDLGVLMWFVHHARAVM